MLSIIFLGGAPQFSEGIPFAGGIERQSCSLLYSVNHKKDGSTFVIITLENLNGF